MSFNLLCSSFMDIRGINRRHEQINLDFSLKYSLMPLLQAQRNMVRTNLSVIIVITRFIE